MSFSNNDFMPCEQVLPNIVLYIDHEIFDDQQLNAVVVLLKLPIPKPLIRRLPLMVQLKLK